MFTLSVILARAGSKGLPQKCVRPLRGRAVIEYTFDDALQSRLTHAVVLTTDCAEAAALAQARGIECIDRPPELATDTATVDAAVRHAVDDFEAHHNARVDAVIMLYGNVPVRPAGIIDRAVAHLVESGADSVRTVAPVGKHHPDWMFRIDGDRMHPYRANTHYRRQDLDPLCLLDGAVTVVTRRALFAALDTPDDRQAFLGADRRAITVGAGETIDIDEPFDLHLAETILRTRAAGRHS